MMKRDALESFGVVLAGMGIGVGVAMLFAPQSGAKTRRRLGKYARRTAEDLLDEGWDTIETVADRGKEYLETGKEKAKEAVQTAAKTFKDSVLRQTN